MTNKFDLSTHGLAAQIVDAAGKVLFAQTFAALLEQQQQLGNVVGDAALAVKAATYQSKVKSGVSYFRQANVYDFILFLGEVENVGALVQAFSSVMPNSYSDLDKDTAVKCLDAVVQSLCDVMTFSSLMVGRFNLSETSLSSISVPYHEAVEDLIKEESVDIQSVSSLLDKIQQQINSDIQSIVTNGLKVGDAVKDLVQTTIASLGIGGDGEDTQKYTISGIGGLVDGTGAASEAAGDLNHQNDLLAANYKKLAALNSAVTLAKSVQAQNDLYANALESCVSAVKNTSSLIEDIDESFKSAADSFSVSVSDSSDYSSFQRALSVALIEWKDLRSQIDMIKLAFSGSGNLPVSA